MQFKFIDKDYLEELIRFEQSNNQWPWSTSHLQAVFESKYTHIIGYFRDTALVGYLIFNLIENELEIQHLIVAKDLRFKGYGTALLAEMMRQAKVKQVKEIFLEVRSKNFSAISLYNTAGFKCIGERERYYKNPLDKAVLMKIDL